jgi:hypothetical protein
MTHGVLKVKLPLIQKLRMRPDLQIHMLPNLILKYFLLLVSHTKKISLNFKEIIKIMKFHPNRFILYRSDRIMAVNAACLLIIKVI